MARVRARRRAGTRAAADEPVAPTRAEGRSGRSTGCTAPRRVAPPPEPTGRPADSGTASTRAPGAHALGAAPPAPGRAPGHRPGSPRHRDRPGRPSRVPAVPPDGVEPVVPAGLEHVPVDWSRRDGPFELRGHPPRERGHVGTYVTGPLDLKRRPDPDLPSVVGGPHRTDEQWRSGRQRQQRRPDREPPGRAEHLYLDPSPG